MDKDAFARSSAARAWQAAREANQRIEEILARLESIEGSPPMNKWQKCEWCGTWCMAPKCAQCLDLVSAVRWLEEALGG